MEKFKGELKEIELIKIQSFFGKPPEKDDEHKQILKIKDDGTVVLIGYSCNDKRRIIDEETRRLEKGNNKKSFFDVFDYDKINELVDKSPTRNEEYKLTESETKEIFSLFTLAYNNFGYNENNIVVEDCGWWSLTLYNEKDESFNIAGYDIYFPPNAKKLTKLLQKYVKLKNVLGFHGKE